MKKWNIGWGTTSLCNMNCQFCYSKSRRTGRGDLGLDQWKRFVDENHDRIHTINYGTGENTLSHDWIVLVQYIREKYPNIRQALTTNGYLSEAAEQDDFCMKVFQMCIDEVDVSLDFFEKEKHNLFRGQKDAYTWAMKALALCAEHGKQITIVFLGSEMNVNERNIDGLFAIAKRYDAILRMNLYRPTEGLFPQSEKFVIKYETVIHIVRYIASKYQVIALNDSLFSPILTGKDVEDPSGADSIRVLANGDITPSTYLIDKKYIVANIQEENVLEKLADGNLIENIIYEALPETCEGCIYSTSCAGGVYDRRYLWFGSLDHRDPYCPGKFAKPEFPQVEVHNDGFQSVHDGYLPTMFFKP